MKRSSDRILTTHVGSLPRPPSLAALLVRQEAGEAVDMGELHREMAGAVKHVVAKQIESGVDVINDGEQPRVGFQTYVPMARQLRASGCSNFQSRTTVVIPAVVKRSATESRDPLGRQVGACDTVCGDEWVPDIAALRSALPG